MKLIFNSTRCPGSVVVHAFMDDNELPDEKCMYTFIGVICKKNDTTDDNPRILIELRSDTSMVMNGLKIEAATYKELKTSMIEHYSKYSYKDIRESVIKITHQTESIMCH